jgi:hypothetical protein
MMATYGTETCWGIIISDNKKVHKLVHQYPYLNHGFSNCGSLSTTGTPTIFAEAALIRKMKYKRD